MTGPWLLRLQPLLLLSCAGAEPGPTAIDVPVESSERASLVDAVWWSEVRRRILADATGFREGPGGSFHAAVGGRRAALTGEGLLVGASGDPLLVRFAAWGRPGAEVAIDPIEPIWGDCAPGPVRTDGRCLHRVERPHPGVTEHWHAVPGGVQQGWDVEVRPHGAGPLVLHVALDGAAAWEVWDEGRAAWILGTDGSTWHYSGLEAWDAVGAPLAAHMVAGDTGLRIVVDDAGAAYPVTVDPALTEDVKLIASDGEPGEAFGASVAGAGDVNRDGFDDVIVGAPFDDASGTQSGSAYVFHGSPAGIDISTETKLTASSGASFDEFGLSVAGAGDVNDDGYDDVIIGAHGDASSAGSAFVYLGSSDGVDPLTEIHLTASDAVAGDSFGYSVAGAGDVDDDGCDDVIVGAFGNDDNGGESGSAYLYMGSSSGTDPDDEMLLLASDGASSDTYGHAVSGAGDVDDDGFDDVIVGSPGDNDNGPDAGAAYVYLGGPAGIVPGSEVKLTASDGTFDDNFGAAVSWAGDVDDDGNADVIVAAPADGAAGFGAGSAYVYLGSAGGIDEGTERKLTASDAGVGDGFGTSVSGAGSADGDRYDDVIIGAPGADSDAGAAYLYLGSDAGVDRATETRLVLADGSSGDELGVSVAGVGDVNDDGFDDTLIGASEDDSDGTATLFVGTCSLVEWYEDADGDGHGDPSSTVEACARPDGYVATADDCDDGEPLAWAGATEVCDGADNDCDGTVDNDDAVDVVTWYLDADGDGYTDAKDSAVACDPPSGYGEPSKEPDCNDGDPAVFPGADEVCNGADEDCDGVIDDDAIDATTWYGDADGDGYTVADRTVSTCDQPVGYGPPSAEEDCDDTWTSTYPGAEEIPNDGRDQDCDGADLEADPEAKDVAEDGCGGCASRPAGSGALAAWWACLAVVARRRAPRP